MRQSKIPKSGVQTSLFPFDGETDTEVRARSTTHRRRITQVSATEEQRRGVEKAQNAARGRPKRSSRKKTPKRGVRFEADEALILAVEDLHYRLKRTKHDLYTEALQLLIDMYSSTSTQ